MWIEQEVIESLELVCDSDVNDTSTPKTQDITLQEQDQGQDIMPTTKTKQGQDK